MNQHSGVTQSVWMRTAQFPSRGPLRQDASADVCVVGAGISGLTTAYLLARAGKTVIVIDDGPIGGGETERTSAHLSNALDDRYSWLERKHGKKGAWIAAESHTAAITQIETIVTTENIKCDFKRLDGYLFVPPGVDPKELHDEMDAAHRAGLTNVDLVQRPPFAMYETTPVLRFPGQGQFHALDYLFGLCDAFERMGGKVYTDTRANEIAGGSPVTIETEQGPQITCRAVVVATNTPVNDRVVIHTKQAPYRTYVVGIRVPGGSVPQALYWDTAQDADEARAGHLAAYHYVRLQSLPGSSDELLIVGGEDHKTAQADDMADRWNRLETWARRCFPTAGKVEYRWSGQVMEPVDGMAFIGRNPGSKQENVFLITGDSGHGLTHGTIGGMLIRDLILGRDNPWADLYDPSRKSVSSVTEFAKENLNVAAKYVELVSGGDVRSVDDLQPDTGAVIRKGTKKIAVYRDEQGAIHEFSAICPHLKCVVHWNHAERSWDCPCHGSRFTRFGEVINGPSLSNLEAVEVTLAGRR